MSQIPVTNISTVIEASSNKVVLMLHHVVKVINTSTFIYNIIAQAVGVLFHHF